MHSMIVPNNFFNNLTVLNEDGRESVIYLSEDSKEIYKIYNNSCFEKPTEQKIIDLYQRQKRTSIKLPDGLIFAYNEHNEKEFIGISMEYLKDYVSIDNLKNDNVNCVKKVFLNIINRIKELTDNNIYPTDLNSKNILVDEETLDIQIIDLDGEHCFVSDKVETIKQKEIYGLLLFRILFKIFEMDSQADLIVNKYGYRGLSSLGYSDEFIKMLKKEEPINYDKLIGAIKEFDKINRKTSR